MSYVEERALLLSKQAARLHLRRKKVPQVSGLGLSISLRATRDYNSPRAGQQLRSEVETGLAV